MPRKVNEYLRVTEVIIKNGRYFYNCICKCGNKKVIRKGHIDAGKIISCGCYRLSQVTRHKESNPQSVEYRTWLHMKQRCEKEYTKGYKNWGGRGIKVCKRWNEYKNFLSDMGRRPGKGYSIDRINNDGNYTPNNCRWATRQQQRNNQRNSYAEKV